MKRKGKEKAEIWNYGKNSKNAYYRFIVILQNVIIKKQDLIIKKQKKKKRQREGERERTNYDYLVVFDSYILLKNIY